MKKPEFWLVLCGVLILLGIAVWQIGEKEGWFQYLQPEPRPTMANALLTFGPLDNMVVITPTDLSNMTQAELIRLGALISLVEFYKPNDVQSAWLGQKLLPQYIQNDDENSLSDKQMDDIHNVFNKE